MTIVDLSRRPNENEPGPLYEFLNSVVKAVMRFYGHHDKKIRRLEDELLETATRLDFEKQARHEAQVEVEDLTSKLQEAQRQLAENAFKKTPDSRKDVIDFGC